MTHLVFLPLPPLAQFSLHSVHRGDLRCISAAQRIVLLWLSCQHLFRLEKLPAVLAEYRIWFLFYQSSSTSGLAVLEISKALLS